MSGPRQDGARTAPGIAVLDELDEPTYRAVCGLLTQLTTSAPVPTFDGLSEVVNTPCTRLLVARDEAVLLGMLTLVLVRLPTGLVAHVEDVVVAEGARDKGVGRRLAQTALSLAAAAGARHVDLTSRPDREAANHLYRSLGFHRRDTNLYRYVIAHDGLGT